MGGEDSDRARHPESLIDLAKPGARLGGPAGGEHHNRWSGATEARAENRIVFELERLVKAGDKSGACRLVPAIPERFPQVAVLPRPERVDHQQRALQVEDRV